MATASSALRAGASSFSGWRMVALACLCTNVGAGLVFAIFGVFLAPVAAEFGASRSVASAGLSIAIACMGLLGPVVSQAVHRWSVRTTMCGGLVLLAAGWALASRATNAWQFAFSFGLLGGTAAACLLVVPPMILVNNWFVAQRGRAAGLVIMPVLVMLSPPIAAIGITGFGWRSTALLIALVPLVLIPIAWRIVDRPEQIGQRPLGADNDLHDALEDYAAGIPDHAADTAPPLRDPVFWLLMACTGILGGAALVIAGHLVPFATGTGIDLRKAAFLASVFGAAGLFGGPLGGVLADRIGGARAFALIAFMQCLVWPALLMPLGYLFLTACVAVIGLCANAMMPVVTTLFATVFGRNRFARVMGLFPIMTLPFNFALPLLAGVLFDLTGSYAIVFLICAGLFMVAGGLAWFLTRHRGAHV